MNTVCRLVGAALSLSLMFCVGAGSAVAQGATQTPQKKTTPKAKPAGGRDQAGSGTKGD